MNKIFFSIIIPVLNEENYILDALRSLERQTESNFEVIIVENGSQDNTLKVIKNYKKTSKLKIKIVFCKKRGISYARNFGSKKARGEYLIFFDADGLIANTWIEVAGKLLKNKPDIKICGGPIFYTSSNPYNYILYNAYLYGYIILSLLIAPLWKRCYHFCGNNMLINKELFFKLGGFPNIVGEDIEFTKIIHKKNVPKQHLYFSPKLKVYYSSRRFKAKGFVRNVIDWIRDFSNKKDSSKYDLYR